MLGFEYGFSLGIAGSGLVAWEAQFGDFTNNAQAMIDQFVAAGLDATASVSPGTSAHREVSIHHLGCSVHQEAKYSV